MNRELIESEPLDVLIIGYGNMAGSFDQSRNPDVFPTLMRAHMSEIIDAKPGTNLNSK